MIDGSRTSTTTTTNLASTGGPRHVRRRAQHSGGHRPELSDVVNSDGLSCIDVTKLKAVPGFRPVHEWQLMRMQLAPLVDDAGRPLPSNDHESGLSLGLLFRAEGLFTNAVDAVWTAAGLPFARRVDPHRPAQTVFRIDPDVYPAAHRAFLTHPLLAKIPPLWKELWTLVDRQRDPALFNPSCSGPGNMGLAERWALVPEALRHELKPFQRLGVEYLWRRYNCGFIADEMGLGKSIQAITAVLINRAPTLWPLVIVAPAVACFNWRIQWCQWVPNAAASDVFLLTNGLGKQGATAARFLSRMACRRTLWGVDGDEYVAESANAPQRGSISISSASSSTSMDPSVDPSIAQSLAAVPLPPAPNPKRAPRRHLAYEQEKLWATATSYVGKVIVLSYSLLVQEAVKEQLRKCKFPTQIYDEAHSLKNPDAQRTGIVDTLIESARQKIFLSGTPGCRPYEFYSYFRMLFPWAFPRIWCPYPKSIIKHEDARAYRPKQFCYVSRYCDPVQKVIRNHGKHPIRTWETKAGTARVEELASISQHYLYIRRLKTEVAMQLPPLYRTRLVMEVDKKEDLDKLKTIMTEMNSMEEHSRLHDKKFMEVYNSVLPTIKWPLVELRFRDAFGPNGEMGQRPTEKSIVFAHHLETLSKLDALFTALNVPHHTMSGDSEAEEREDYIRQFQQESASTMRVLILSISAFNTAITLTRATKVYMVELVFSPDVMIQAENRAHRIGTTSPVEIEYLLLHDSMDMMLWNMVERKQTLSTIMTDQRALLNGIVGTTIPSTYERRKLTVSNI